MVAALETSSQRIRRMSREFALYVLDSRAIPTVTDGLKESQRIALWLIRNAPKNKTSALVGDMIKSKLYVHGDAAAGDAIGQLAAPYNNNIPLIEGEGAFGTRRKPVDGIGAPRYTSVKPAKFAHAALYVDLDVVPMKENYDGSATMPRTFLPLIPLVLLNGIKGIATGYSTDILPRAYEDIVAATLAAIDGKPIKKLVPFWNRYDLGVRDLGENKYEVMGKFRRDGTSRIVVTELPPSMDVDSFAELLNTLEEEEKIKDWTDASKKTINFEIQFKRGSVRDMTDEDIVSLLKLRTTRTERIVVLGWDGHRPVQYASAEQLVEDFANWRFGWYETRYQHLVEEERNKLTYWFSLHACYEANLSAELQKMKSKDVLKQRIDAVLTAAEIPVVPEFVERIAQLPGYKWTEEGREEAVEKLNECVMAIQEYEDILAKPERRRSIFRDEVTALKKVKT